MPVLHRLEDCVVILQPIGAYSPEDLRAAWVAAERDPAFPPPPAAPLICIDLRASESIAKRSIAELRDANDWFIERTHNAARACALVAQPGFQYGLARMMCTWTEMRGFPAFATTELDEALQWLRGV